MYIWTHGPRIINTFPSLDVLVSRCAGVLVSGYRGIQVCCGWMSLNSTFKTPGEDTQPRPRQALPLPLAPFT